MQWFQLLAFTSSLLLLSLGPVTSQFLPGALCLSARALFISQGCAHNETVGCRVLALVFTSRVDGEDICEGFPCTGYNEPNTRMCRSYRHCSFGRMNIKGICDPSLICCSTSSNDENGSQENYKKTELKDQDHTVFNDLAFSLSKDFMSNEGTLKTILKTGMQTEEGLSGSDITKILAMLGTALSGKDNEDLGSTFGPLLQQFMAGLAGGDKMPKSPNSAGVSGQSGMNLGRVFAGIKQLGDVLDRSDLGKKINEVLDSIEGGGHNKYGEDLNSVASAEEIPGKNAKEIFDVFNSISDLTGDKSGEQEKPGMTVVT